MIDANKFFSELLVGSAKAFGATATPNADGTATVKAVSGAKIDRHIVLIPNTVPCPSELCPNFAQVGKCYDAMLFDSLIAAEACRTKFKRWGAVDVRMVSSAKACEQFQKLFAAAKITQQSKELVEFLAQLYAEAKSPQLN
jgi:hypothetical protein